MNILGGVLRPDAGQILLDDKPQTFQNPGQSLDAGIAFINQELNLINDLSLIHIFQVAHQGAGVQAKRHALKYLPGFRDHARMVPKAVFRCV